jgi:HK97 gp10 family phage protein
MPEAIKGLDKIKAQLKRLSSKQVRSINRSATRAGARAIQKEAASNLPPKHKKKLDIQRSRRASRNQMEVFRIGPLAEHWPLVFLEYGARPHDISPKTSKILAIGDFNDQSGTWDNFVYLKKVRHPGIPATHFLSRAIVEGEDKALDAMGKQYWKRIKKLAK